MPAPVAPPVDLLQSVPTQVAVSSVYRNNSGQIAQLADGLLDTAWNSRTDELVGAWIDVRVPQDATVTSIELTAGFAREATGTGTDLFTGNQRIARVRVLHDGAEVGSYPLDAESRALQTLPVSAAGGVYRVEVAAVLAGSRRDWREICVSELRVMGRAPGARAGGGFPRFSVGALPEPSPSRAAADREAVARELRQQVDRFAREWAAYDRDLMYTQLNTGEPEIEPEEAATFRRTRRQLFGRLAQLVEPVDEAAAVPLRRAAALDPRAEERSEPFAWALRQPDLSLAAAGFAAVAAWLASDEARCHWAKAHVGLRLARIVKMLRWEQEAGEWEAMQDEGGGGAGRDTDRFMRVGDQVESVLREWTSNPRAGAARLQRISFPQSSDARLDWAPMTAQLTVAHDACGWQ